MIRALLENLPIEDIGAALPERTALIEALGKTRLKYFADDAPPAGLRFVERFIAGIDSAYNEAAWRQKGQKAGS